MLGIGPGYRIDHLLMTPPAYACTWLEPVALLSALAGVTRTIKLGERVNFKLIAEAFNILNRQNITAVRNTLYNVSTATSAASNPCPGLAAGNRGQHERLFDAAESGIERSPALLPAN